MTFWTFNYAMMILSAIFTALIGVYAYLHRRERGARFLAWVMFFATLNAGGTILERNGGTFELKLFWFNVHESASLLMMAFFIFFVLEYASPEQRLRRSLIVSVLLYFILWASFLWMDASHHLLRDELAVQDHVLMFTSTGLSLGLNIIGFMAVFAALCYMSVYVSKSGPLARKQALWVWLSAAIPILWVITGFVYPLSPELWGVYTTVINVAMGLCMFMALFKYRLLSVVPIAKDHVVEIMQDAVLVVDEKGTVIDCNASARWLFSDHPVGLTGASIQELLSAWPRWREACERFQQDELEIEIGEGQQARVYTVKIMPLNAAGIRRMGTVSILSDNTEDRRRYEQAEQWNRYKDELFSIVSHDIRDPLAVLLNLTEMLDDERARFSPESAEVLDIVKEKAHASYHMVENLLEWVRCQRGGMTLHPRSAPLALMVEEASAWLADKGEAKQIDIRNEVYDGVQVYADREAVSLVLRNLLANAIKYTKPGGTVSIRAEVQEEQVLVTVRDTGIGIEPERMNELFGDLPLHSAPGTAGERGTGIGLLLCKELIQRSGGKIGVSSVPGGGTAFSFSLCRASSSISKLQDAAG